MGSLWNFRRPTLRKLCKTRFDAFPRKKRSIRNNTEVRTNGRTDRVFSGRVACRLNSNMIKPKTSLTPSIITQMINSQTHDMHDIIMIVRNNASPKQWRHKKYNKSLQDRAMTGVNSYGILMILHTKERYWSIRKEIKNSLLSGNLKITTPATNYEKNVVTKILKIWLSRASSLFLGRTM